MPVPVVDDFPQSPAERYIAIRSCMLYDVNPQQPKGVRIPRNPQAPTLADQQTEAHRTLQPQTPRPPYERQESHRSTQIPIITTTSTPVFQAVPDSNNHIGDRPVPHELLPKNLGTLHTQMSHAQHMQAYRQNQTKRYQKKRPYRYVYGPTLQRRVEEKIGTAAILTPQITSTTHKTQRLPSVTPFRYPKTVKETDENDDHDKSLDKRKLRTTVTVIRQKGSSNSLSNVTEV